MLCCWCCLIYMCMLHTYEDYSVDNRLFLYSTTDQSVRNRARFTKKS